MTTLATGESVDMSDGHRLSGVSTYVAHDGSLQRTAFPIRLWPCRGMYPQKSAPLANETDGSAGNPVV